MLIYEFHWTCRLIFLEFYGYSDRKSSQWNVSRNGRIGIGYTNKEIDTFGKLHAYWQVYTLIHYIMVFVEIIFEVQNYKVIRHLSITIFTILLFTYIDITIITSFF